MHSLAVGVPRLVGAVWLLVSDDLAIDARLGLTYPIGNVFNPFVAGKAVGDLDPVILCQVTRADRSVDEAHAASVDEPQ